MFWVVIAGGIRVPENLVQITNHLNISSVIVIDSFGLSFDSNAKLLKQFSAQLKTASFKALTVKNENQNFIIFSMLQDFTISMIPYTVQASVVVTEINEKKDLAIMDMDIGKEIYFLDWKSLKLFECYNINNLKIINQLGNFINENGALTFQGSDGYIESFITRRGNFHGLQMNVMTEQEPPTIDFPSDFARYSRYNSILEAYDITDISKIEDYKFCDELLDVNIF